MTLDCPVEMNPQYRPKMIQMNPDAGGAYQGLKPAIQTAARETFMQNRLDPQLIIVILPVSMFMSCADRYADSVFSEKGVDDVLDHQADRR
jgi:hypothetical protein